MASPPTQPTRRHPGACHCLSPRSIVPRASAPEEGWIPGPSEQVRGQASPGMTSRQPALAPLVGLHVAEALALGAADAEVEFLHVLVLAQRLGIAVHHHAAVLQDVAVAGIAQ